VVKHWWPKFIEIASAVNPFSGSDEPLPPPAAPRPAPVAERRTIIAVPVANVRAGPSPAAGVIASLPAGFEVTPVDRRGIWVQIRFGDNGEQHRQEGWVFGSLLKEITDH
jgi:uncharacterized protein YgiM (DUF1202 family)